MTFLNYNIKVKRLYVGKINDFILILNSLQTIDRFFPAFVSQFITTSKTSLQKYELHIFGQPQITF